VEINTPLEYASVKFAARRVNELGHYISKLMLEPESDRREEKISCATALRDKWMAKLRGFDHIIGIPEK